MADKSMWTWSAPAVTRLITLEFLPGKQLVNTQ